jgi:hypothetical protein
MHISKVTYLNNSNVERYKPPFQTTVAEPNNKVGNGTVINVHLDGSATVVPPAKQ